MLLYSTLHLCGYGISLDDLKNFRQLGSPTAGHPEYGHAPGVEMTTGPLGQGVAHAVGLALGERILAERLQHRRPPSDRPRHLRDRQRRRHPRGHRQRGGLARRPPRPRPADRLLRPEPHHDRGRHRPLDERRRRGRATRPTAGTSTTSARTSISVRSNAPRATRCEQDTQPSLIIVRTHIADGAPNAVDTAGAHGAPLGDDEIELTKEAYGFPSLEPFYVPDEVREHMAPVAERGDAPSRRVARGDGRVPRRPPRSGRRARPRDQVGELPAGWAAEHAELRAEDTAVATRKASDTAIQWAATGVPELVGGSADLAPEQPHHDRLPPSRFTTRRLRRPQPPLRHPRARDGRDRQRPDAQRPARLRRHLPDLLRLHEAVDPAGGADGRPVDLRLHARLDRPRRRRPDPSADRAAVVAARDAQRRRRSVRPTPTRRRWPGSTRSNSGTARPAWRSAARTCR